MVVQKDKLMRMTATYKRLSDVRSKTSRKMYPPVFVQNHGKYFILTNMHTTVVMSSYYVELESLLLDDLFMTSIKIAGNN